MTALVGNPLRLAALEIDLYEAGLQSVAVGISVAMRCDDCIVFHVNAAIEKGASREEVMETMGMAIYKGAAPPSCMRRTWWRHLTNCPVGELRRLRRSESMMIRAQ